MLSVDSGHSYMQVKEFCKQYLNNNDFFLIHINIPSLNKNFEKLEQLLENLGKLLDLIAISETELNSEFDSYFQATVLYKLIQTQRLVELIQTQKL